MDKMDLQQGDGINRMEGVYWLEDKTNFCTFLEHGM